MTGVRRGVVVAFDDQVGLGRVSSPGAPGAPEAVGDWEFHCTQIAGGSRSIEVGTPVMFSVRAGRLGRWEAVGITEAP